MRKHIRICFVMADDGMRNDKVLYNESIRKKKQDVYCFVTIHILFLLRMAKLVYFLNMQLDHPEMEILF